MPSDKQLVTPNVDDLFLIPKDETGPVFSEPWEASAFALAVQLSSEKHFSWQEWATTLAKEIKSANLSSDPNIRERYYLHWLRALERLCISKGLITKNEINQRQEEWRMAYLNTEHGQPVSLEAAHKAAESSPHHLHEL
tara:strand:+ start:1301 stop:1717 length:417 start_codon:yes stop_codon:yes gene_type:complete